MYDVRDDEDDAKESEDAPEDQEIDKDDDTPELQALRSQAKSFQMVITTMESRQDEAAKEMVKITKLELKKCRHKITAAKPLKTQLEIFQATVNRLSKRMIEAATTTELAKAKEEAIRVELQVAKARLHELQLRNTHEQAVASQLTAQQALVQAAAQMPVESQGVINALMQILEQQSKAGPYGQTQPVQLFNLGTPPLAGTPNANASATHASPLGKSQWTGHATPPPSTHQASGSPFAPTVRVGSQSPLYTPPPKHRDASPCVPATRQGRSERSSHEGRRTRSPTPTSARRNGQENGKDDKRPQSVSSTESAMEEASQGKVKVESGDELAASRAGTSKTK